MIRQNESYEKYEKYVADNQNLEELRYMSNAYD